MQSPHHEKVTTHGGINLEEFIGMKLNVLQSCEYISESTFQGYSLILSVTDLKLYIALITFYASHLE